MTAVQWLILDNLKNGWTYSTNICSKDDCDREYLRLVEDEYIKDGKITDKGRIALINNPIR